MSLTTDAPLASVGGRPLTAKGRATRQRIVETASRLMLEVGVERATIDDIQRVAGVNASQLYHYFVDKNALILAVIDHQTETVLDIHRSRLTRVESFDGLVAWRDMIIDVLQAQQCVGGCPIGSLASDLVETNLDARTALQASFAAWEELLHSGLATMRVRGLLPADLDLDRAALALLAAVQGGLLLSQTRRDTIALEAALDAAIDHLRSLSPAR
ncbi:TetR family transcriptional regulator [Frondihabitans sp. PhB188]|uniref:TetR/AcrR family transcriptional regulator n=1 Tax=Frondihabitans sp. PhB188 TaxID=2485200 RepID=UPI000F4605CC|nr:TetR/AcrR family transcriptional regulator [Frondihabitans sp. PhB188]ROQ36577.1 TetR family transcriptional regulator [Frondihabitans sp. PhB188]